MAISILLYIIITADVSEEKGDKSWKIPYEQMIEAFTNAAALKEFMNKDGLILVTVVVLFKLARSYNNYLD